MTLEIMRTQNTSTRTKELYFEYLCSKISTYGSKPNMNKRYERLLRHLYSIEYYSDIDMDNNRIADAIEMRAEYEDNVRRDVNVVCSVLEVLVALVSRVENTVMEDDEYGDRTGR